MSDNAPVGFSFADVTWRGLHPYANAFEDGYYALCDNFNRVDALAECQYVFLDANQLEQRFANLKAGQRFTIAETGFGTGLNFLAVCELWARVAHPKARLQFISIEKYPLHYADMNKALDGYSQQWPKLSPFSSALKTQYHNLVPLLQTWELKDLNINLHLIIADIHKALRLYDFKAEAWFLDGFAPSKNADMWHSDVMQLIAAHSHDNTSLATFTAAGFVKRGLKQSGFTLHKRAGFAGKREMIQASYNVDMNNAPKRLMQPWQHYHNTSLDNPRHSQRFLILGAGVSGSALANELSDIAQITVWDINDSHSGRNGNCPAHAIAYSRLYAQDNLLNQWNLQSYSHFVHKMMSTPPNYQSEIWQQSGLVQRYTSEQAKYRFDALYQAKTLNGIGEFCMQNQTVIFNDSGYINTRALIDYYLKSDNIDTEQKKVTTIRPLEHGYAVFAGNDKYFFDAIFIACGHHSIDVLGCVELKNGERPFTDKTSPMINHLLPFNKVKGQETLVRFNKPHGLHQVICDNVYAIPVDNYTLAIGAGFYRDNLDTSIDPVLHTQNIDNARKMSGLADLNWQSADIVDSFSGIRFYTPDYLPYFGHCILADKFYQSFYHGLNKDRHFYFDENALQDYQHCILQNLYLFTAMGARGVSSGALAAKKMKQQLINPKQITSLLDDALHPARFLARSIYKHEI